MDNWTVPFLSSMKIPLSFRDAEFDTNPDFDSDIDSDFDLDDLPQQFYRGESNKPAPGAVIQVLVFRMNQFFFTPTGIVFNRESTIQMSHQYLS